MKKLITIKLLVVIILLSSCKENYTLRKVVIGRIVNNDLPLKDVSLKYDSTDVLSPQNIKTDNKGFFIMPKIELSDYKEFISRQKEINNDIIIKKENFKNTTIKIDKYDKSIDTIDLGIIQLDKI
ncbi:hypothetical protein [[Flexibacter] sp. ATCC 35103]|uniref:hypothetical protein n=1 Tax=[Flexibacter] sp. ATCC 35103 TaxID=1937528 RepID=UPI0009CB0337|nr:hypothetical protein [[Flexibacter] sp. ATCC 35103]OMQ10523.1 hypothetical protein BXU01_14720 [[Flexibacter] sp. ATCC 35103]